MMEDSVEDMGLDTIAEGGVSTEEDKDDDSDAPHVALDAVRRSPATYHDDLGCDIRG